MGTLFTAPATGNGPNVPQPLTVTDTLYNPESAMVVVEINGFCEVDEKLFGPVHE
jgi:hypothetical protein